jgi:hypothetical protein
MKLNVPYLADNQFREVVHQSTVCHTVHYCTTRVFGGVEIPVVLGGRLSFSLLKLIETSQDVFGETCYSSDPLEITLKRTKGWQYFYEPTFSLPDQLWNHWDVEQMKEVDNILSNLEETWFSNHDLHFAPSMALTEIGQIHLWCGLFDKPPIL